MSTLQFFPRPNPVTLYLNFKSFKLDINSVPNLLPNKNAKLLLEWGADVDSLTYKRETPLMYACRYMRNVDLVKLLLSYNANIELTNYEGEKALDICRNNSSSRTLALQVFAQLTNNDIEKNIIKLLHPLYRQM